MIVPIQRTDRRRRDAAVGPEVAFLLVKAEALNYDELHHTIARLIRGTGKENIPIPYATMSGDSFHRLL